MKELTDFIKATLSGGRSESFSRTSCAIVLYFLLLWTTYLVFKIDVITDIPAQWALLISALYLGGKALDRKGATDVTRPQQ
ncbi:MAG: hypothetical protein HGB26_06200 [Desulfobulbaceae bacterium]|nr:hypothetical protein [Desulfobulbaceae bacterium]